LPISSLNNTFQAGGTKTQTITIDSTDEIPEDADYSQVRIEDFGMAVLRGYGFKEDEGIGKGANKRVVNVTRQERRVKNLGLGAKIASEEDLKNLKIGSKVLITSGTSAEKYGIIESIDGDNMSCYIKLALTKNIVKVSQLNVKLVSSKEYEQNSKVLILQIKKLMIQLEKCNKF
jgi:G patch domain/KOW motif-containing protein